MSINYNKLQKTSVAGNTTTTFINSSRVCMEVNYGQVLLTTANSSVVIRRPIIGIVDDANATFLNIHAGVGTPANTAARHHEFVQGAFREVTVTGTSLMVSMPMQFLIPPGWKFQVSIENGLASDSYDASFMFYGFRR
jgi:hypothetical protein